MKTIKKQIIKISGIILAAALFFSCDNPTTPVLPQNQSTENLTPPSNPPSTPPTNPATPARPAGSGAANSSGTSATLNPETLPDNVGTDPFAGTTYRINYLNNHYTEYTFGNDGTLIYMENEGGRKYQYTYNSNNKELSRRQIEEYHNDCNSAYAWRTYDQIVELYNN